MNNIPAYQAKLTNSLSKERHAKALALRETGINPYANGFNVTHTANELYAAFGEISREDLKAREADEKSVVRVAGRIRFFRKMGKASFVKIQDRTCRPALQKLKGENAQDLFLQIFLSKKMIGDAEYAQAKQHDLGDFIGVEGTPMRTRTGELTIQARKVILLTKNIRPLPDKHKGLLDVEQRYRQRYIDLVMNEKVREVFYARSLIVRRIREFLDARGYLEVETPMMHPQAGGATARPFVTHHNTLDMELFLRIAPELYLKRLLVGGFERVYEINRNFRNEGLSRRHNPEFTMVEFYQAYATYEDLMVLTEKMVFEIAKELHGEDENGRVCFKSDGHMIDVTSPWRRITMAGSVAEALNISEETLKQRDFLLSEAKKLGHENAEKLDDGKLLAELFEAHVEPHLIQPTFITAFPASISPLSRRNNADPTLVDRFELFVLGQELANAFSELNDPEDQYNRFAQQLRAREAGDEEAMPMDEDYIRALEYGMPPAAGEGIGIDRLVMFLTDSASIRDVILFPLLRPEVK